MRLTLTFCALQPRENLQRTSLCFTPLRNGALSGFAFKCSLDSIELIGFVPSKLFLLILLGLSALLFELY